MRVPYQWLKEFVDLDDLSAAATADRLSAAGVSIELVEERNRAGVSGVVAGTILELDRHPNADRLKVASVGVSDGRTLQIVTGAPNVRRGDCVPVAIEGARLPGGVRIKKSALRGVPSEGMMCSAAELDIEIKDLPAEQREGVLILPPGTPSGADVLALMAINEQVLVIEPFANRPDYLSILGIAREVAAALGRPLRHLELAFPEEADVPCAERISVAIADPTLCSRYVARIIDRLQVGPTPLWMVGRLHAAGYRSVNNVVDITNYVMLETGQPLHAFDLARLQGGRLEVRAARAGERMVSIDGIDRALDERMLVIADAERPVAIAGVMGGLQSEVSAETVTVLLESANFNPVSVRRTSARLGLRSESSRRFEKGLDPHGAEIGSRRAAHLLASLCGGRVARGEVSVGAVAPPPVSVHLRPDRVNHVLGTQIASERQVEILRRLDFVVEPDAEGYSVTVPTFRPDVRREEDLIEEVARHHGYDAIPGLLPRAAHEAGRISTNESWEERIRDILVGLGLTEAITLSLLHETAYDRMHWRSSRDVTVKNPLVADQSALRTTLLPHLTGAAVHNLRARATAVQLFELSKIYLAASDPAEGPVELRRLALIMAGRVVKGDPWVSGGNETDEPLGFYHLKGLLDALLGRLRLVGTWQAAPADTLQDSFHPGKTALLHVGDRAIGVVGVLHPAVQEACDVDVEMVAAELDLDALLGLVGDAPTRFTPIGRFPAVDRDLALVVAEEVPSGAVEAALQAAGGSLLQTVRCFDLYRGSQIPAGYKNLAYALSFESAERTLTEADIDAAMQAIVDRVGRELKATVRT